VSQLRQQHELNESLDMSK